MAALLVITGPDHDFMLVYPELIPLNNSMALRLPDVSHSAGEACTTHTHQNSSTSTAAPSRTVTSWGDCKAPVDLRLDAGGRRATLLQDVVYTDKKGRSWLAPKGWVVDGASIPRPFWAVIGGPWEGRYRFASVIHDVACDQKNRPWDEAARMFYEAMRCSGVRNRKAKVNARCRLQIWAALACAGPQAIIAPTCGKDAVGDSEVNSY